ncbi:MAG: molybdopterin-guanine dinucleotide biosynthesis protein MobB [Sulfolobales archaeon]
MGRTLRPYIVRFISQKSGVGKTFIASSVVEALVKAGYSVAVVKHSASGISLEEKDSARYLGAGAMEVAVASKELVLLYSKTITDDLSEIANYISRPLIIVEGFKDAHIGDSIVVAEFIEEATGIISSDTIAIVLSKEPLNPGLEKGVNIPIFFSNQIGSLVDLIIKRSIEHFTSQLPGLNCGACGYSYCRTLAMKIIKGVKVTCPITLSVRLTVNGQEVRLNPFVKNVISSVVEGLLSSLKGIPADVKRITLEIDKTASAN